MVVNPVDLSSVEDGTYSGSYKSGRFSNEVRVTVEDQRIKDIQVVKDMLVANPETTQGIIQKVIEKQNTTIDIVSSSTVTTKAYLKSIEDALTK